MANLTALNFSLITCVPPTASSPSRQGRKLRTAGLWQARGRNGREPLEMAKATVSGTGTGSGSGPGSVGKYKGTHMREKQLTEMIEKKVMEAKEVCGQDQNSDECKVAWDEVEEVSQAKADLRLKLEIMHQDPLESFCQENPETDECRLYED